MRRESWRRTGPICLGLALITLATFAPALRNGFVWDDEGNLWTNPAYRGLGWAQLRWMFTTVHLGHYLPLTWVTFGLDYLIWGMNPLGYHLTNLVLHAANAILVFLVARRLLGKATALSETALDTGATVAALFFAVHPLRVESVAWVTERRDVLSGFFFLATILSYLRAAEAEGRRRCWLLSLSVAAYLLALASKSLVMTLPAVLLVLDVYPLGRLGPRPRDLLGRSARTVWAEKVPYVLLSGLAAGMSYYGLVARTALAEYPWPTRVLRAVYSLWFYLVKTLVPLGLSPVYEVPLRPDPLGARFLPALVGVAAIVVLLWYLRRRWPAGLAASLYYVILLAPVSGVAVSPGFELAADRYSYLACLGWALLAGAGVAWLVRRREEGAMRPARAGLAAGVAVVWLVALGTLTWQLVPVWHDTGTLWRHAVAVTPECAACENNLGVWLMRQGAPAAALEHFAQAAALRPDRFTIHETNIGLALAKLGRLPEAVGQYTRVLQREPDAVDVRLYLVAALWRMGKPDEAVEQLQEAVRITPDNVALHLNLGGALLALGRAGEAVVPFQRAVELSPTAKSARLGLAQAYTALGRTDLARRQQEALKAMGSPE